MAQSSGDRWTTVSKALKDELDQHGSPPPGETFVSADYFHTLTEMELPSKVRELDQQDGSRLGIIDVIVTFGEGSKFGPDTPYLTEPAPIRILTPSQNRPAYLRPTPKHLQAKTNEEAFQVYKTTGEAAVESISATRSSRLYGVAESLSKDESTEAPSPPSTSYLLKYIEASGSISKDEALAALHDVPPLIAGKPKWQNDNSAIYSTKENTESNPHEAESPTKSDSMKQRNDNVPLFDNMLATSIFGKQGANNVRESMEGGSNTALNTLDVDTIIHREQLKSLGGLESMSSEKRQILSSPKDTLANDSMQMPQDLPVNCQQPRINVNSNTRNTTAFASSTQATTQEYVSHDATMEEAQTGHLPSQNSLSIEHTMSRTSQHGSVSTHCAFNFSDISSSLSSPPPSTADSRQSSPEPTQWHTIKVADAQQGTSGKARKATDQRKCNAQSFDGASEAKPTSVPPDKRYAIGDNEGIWAETRRPNQPSGFGKLTTPRLTRSTSLLSDDFKSTTNAISRSGPAKRTNLSNILASQSHTSSLSSSNKRKEHYLTETNTAIIKDDREGLRKVDPTAKGPSSIASTPADRRMTRVRKSIVTSTPTSKKRSSDTLTDTESKPSKKRKSSGMHPLSTPDCAPDQPNPMYDTDFEPGEMNENCIIGYAEPGMVRNVHTRRGGWFKEKGVLMGVRFVLW